MITSYLNQKYEVTEFSIDYGAEGLQIHIREEELKKKISKGFRPISISWIGSKKLFLLEKEL